MTETLKVLAQLNPSSGVLTDFYTVPGVTSTVVSSIVICNQHSAPIAIRVSVAVGGAGDDPKQYLYYDLPLIDNDTFIATIGMSLAAGDIIRVMTNVNNTSFTLFGDEVS